MSAIGYAQLPDVKAWEQAEIRYAKSQLTWFKTNKNIHWFDLSQSDLFTKVVRLVDSWYTRN